MEAAIKLAHPQEDQIICLPSRRPGASPDLGPLNFVFLEAALATDLITASISLQRIKTVSKYTKRDPQLSKLFQKVKQLGNYASKKNNSTLEI